MAADKFEVGLVQMSCSPEPDENLERAVTHVREAARRGAQVICLPELFRTQYFCQREDTALFDLAEPIPGPSTARFCALARELKVAIVVSLLSAAPPASITTPLSSSATTAKSAASTARCTSLTIPSITRSITSPPATSASAASILEEGSVGTLVCWDQWYPEGARLTALQGANVLLYPTAIGWHPAEKDEWGAAQYEAWFTIQRAHAIANGVFVGAVNRVGHETGNIRGNQVPGAGLDFWGGSFLSDPFGRIIAKASHDQEEILLGTVDMKLQEEIRRNWPFLRDRRIDAYAPITQRFGK